MQHNYPSASSELTDREKQCLTLAAQGYSDEQIGRRIHLERATVKNKMHTIYRKLGVDHNSCCRTRAVLLAWERGDIDLPIRLPSGARAA